MHLLQRIHDNVTYYSRIDDIPNHLVTHHPAASLETTHLRTPREWVSLLHAAAKSGQRQSDTSASHDNCIPDKGYGFIIVDLVYGGRCLIPKSRKERGGEG